MGAPTEPAAELRALQERVAALEAQLAEANAEAAALRQQAFEQEVLLRAIPALIYFKDRDHRYLRVNDAYAASLEVDPERIKGRSDHEIFAPEVADNFHATDEAVMASGLPRIDQETELRRADGSEWWISEHNIPFRDESGAVVGMVGIAIDITARKAAEESLRASERQLRETVEQQERLLETIKALATPLLPIEDGILVLPLVGHIDSVRGDQIMEALLAGVQAHAAAWVIIDITGVPVIDTSVANHLLQAIRAVQLLGGRCMLVGVSPEIAQTIVQLGMDLSGLMTRGNLQAGIAYAQAARRRIGYS